MAERLQIIQMMHAADLISATIQRVDVVDFHAVVTPSPNHAADAVGAFCSCNTTCLTGVFIPPERKSLSPGPLMLVQEYVGTLLTAPPGLASG